VRNGYLYSGENRCFEHEPGLFLSTNGEALDFRSGTPTWANIPLRRVSGAEKVTSWVSLGEEHRDISLVATIFVSEFPRQVPFFPERLSDQQGKEQHQKTECV
jgi:hypothetical protein